jgi:drug/metabolite transporter (DMT)-like permease
MSSQRGPLGTVTLTVLSLFAFAANSLLCRMALGAHAIDAASFTSVRLLSGAIVLAVLVRVRRPRAETGQGSWLSALLLFTYAFAFSQAYLVLSTGVGALILFGCVQATMISVGIARGQRPRRVEWLGVALALAGLVVLTFPGLSAPDPRGALLMAGAGIAWGGYSLRGSGVRSPLDTTADNFLRSLPFAAVACLPFATTIHASPYGLLLAVVSGALASGVGYSIWYTALPKLSALHAAVVQLIVPVLAAGAGAIVLSESMSVRVLVAALAILGGIALAIFGRTRRAC